MKRWPKDPQPRGQNRSGWDRGPASGMLSMSQEAWPPGGWAVGVCRAGCPLCCHWVASCRGPPSFSSNLQTFPCSTAGATLCRRKPGLEHLLKDLRDFLLPLGFVIRICKRLQQNYMILYNKKSSTKLKGEEPTGEVCPLQREQRVYVKKLLHYHLSAPFPLERT